MFKVFENTRKNAQTKFPYSEISLIVKNDDQQDIDCNSQDSEECLLESKNVSFNLDI